MSRRARCFGIIAVLCAAFPFAVSLRGGMLRTQDDEAPLPPNVFVGPLYGQYLPADEVFKKVYGNGGSMLGVQFGFRLAQSGPLSLALVGEATTFSQTGASTISQTQSSLSFTPLRLGLEAHLTRSVVGIWLGGGLNSIAYTEESPLQNSSGSAIGYHVNGGFLFQIPSLPFLALKLYARWTKAVVHLTDFDVDLGGTEYGLILLFRFKI